MKVTCAHCALPFSVVRVAPVRPVYCCSGCALAARVPVDQDGNFPVNGAAITATSLAFVAFNQGLFWALAILLRRQAAAGGEGAMAQALNADRFAWASLLVAAGLWLALTILQVRVGARRAVDWIVVAAAAGTIACGVITGSLACAAGGNVLLIVWALRGVRRKKITPVGATTEG